MLQYKIITDITTEPVTLAEAKAQIRVIGNDDDTLISSYISVAREYCEDYTGKAFGQKTVEAVADEIGTYELPLKTISSLTSVIATDSEGTEHNITADFTVNYYSSKLVYEGSNNLKLATVNPVKITYVANGAPSKKSKQAMLLLIGHYYENREATSSNAIVEIPEGVHRLLDFERHPYM